MGVQNAVMLSCVIRTYQCGLCLIQRGWKFYSFASRFYIMQTELRLPMCVCACYAVLCTMNLAYSGRYLQCIAHRSCGHAFLHEGVGKV